MLKKIPNASALMSLCLGVALPAWAGASQKSAASNETVFNIPIGQEDVRYADEGIEEMIPWGPAAFTVAPDGSFWIADTAGNHLVRYSSRGDRLQAHSLQELLVGATDVEVKDQELVVLGEHQQDSTSTLSEISTAISTSSLLQGDILNLAGSQMVLFNYTTSTGLDVWEATKSSSYDRVVYRHISWSYVSVYTPRRYNYMC